MPDSSLHAVGTTLLALSGALVVVLLVAASRRLVCEASDPQRDEAVDAIDDTVSPSEGMRRAWVEMHYPAVAERLWGKQRR